MTDIPQYHDVPYEDGPEVEILTSRGNRTRAGIAGMAQSRLINLAEDGKLAFVRSFDGLASMSREMAARVDSGGNSMLGGYAWQAANLVSELQDTLREKPVDELLDEGRELIRQQPAVAVGIAVLAGFIAARLVKSIEQ